MVNTLQSGRPRPKKSFGQHFLHDQSVIAKIIAAAEPASFQHVVEVGPGTGALTKELGSGRLLSPLVKFLSLLEADGDLIAELNQNYPSANIIQTDAAAFDYDSLQFGAEPWLLIGNLPYNAGSAIVMKALEAKHPPARLVIMVQKEVGERMLALAGCMSVLSVAVGVYASVERICVVKPGAFNPPPKVDSIVLRLSTPAKSLVNFAKGDNKRPRVPLPWRGDPKQVITLAKAGFANRRKYLVSNLVKANYGSADVIGQWLVSQGKTVQARAEELTVEQWQLLTAHLS